MATTVYTAILGKEGDLYAALCAELDHSSRVTTFKMSATVMRTSRGVRATEVAIAAVA